ncbi:MAG: hypothetical protein IPI88_10740 [Chitinophagaceae bacterium]|nr:hypothetical protein [Chitinophagaceae bacterium]
MILPIWQHSGMLLWIQAGLRDPVPATVTVNWSQTLPVKLISFSGRLNGNKVDLNWVTANELNTKNFEVERGTDGRNFTKIATVTAKGNSSTAISYDQVDPLPIKGINYYRLKLLISTVSLNTQRGCDHPY